MRIGIIGLGRIGAFHAGNLAALDVVDELVVTDAVPGVAETVAAKFNGVAVVDSIDELLRSGVDGVVIASSTPTHLPLLRAAVAAGVPAFCEKPITQDPYAAGDLAEQVESSGVPVQIGFPRRFDPAFQAAKAALDAGDLGWLTTVRSTTLDPSPPPAAYIPGSGGIFRDCAIHDLDAVRWVTGREVLEVYAVGANRGAAFFAESDDVDTASALLTFDDGTIGVISNSRYNGQGHDVRLELHGSRRCGRRRTRRRPAPAFGRPVDRLPRRPRAHLLHGPVRDRVPERVGRLRRSGRRTPAVAVHGHRRAGGQLDRRSLHPIPARAPARTAGRSAPYPTGVVRSAHQEPCSLAHAMALIRLSFQVEPDPNLG